jgi:hypothetical protein
MLFLFAFYPLILFFLFAIIVIMGYWIVRGFRCSNRMTVARKLIITCATIVWSGVVFIELLFLSIISKWH